MYGKIIKTGKVQEGQNKLDLKNIQIGIYFLKLSSDNGSVIKKIIKN